MHEYVIDIETLESNPAYEPKVSALFEQETTRAMHDVYRGLGDSYQATKAARQFTYKRIRRLMGVLLKAEGADIDSLPGAARGLVEFAQRAHDVKQHEAAFAFASNAIWLLHLTKKEPRDCTDEEAREHAEMRQHMFDVVLEAARELMTSAGTDEPTPFMREIMQRFRITLDPNKLMKKNATPQEVSDKT
jgi:hypothetical protein